VRRTGRESVARGGAAEAAFPGRGVREAHVAEGGSPPDTVIRVDSADLARLATVEFSPPRELTPAVRLPRRHGAAKYLLDLAFAGRERLALGSCDPSFASAWKLVGSELAGWRETSPLWDPDSDRRRALARVLGVVAGVAGLLLTAVGAALAGQRGPGWLALVAAGALLAGAGAAAVIRAWELRVRTPAGSGLWLRTESFRRFLAEAHHAEEAAKRGHLREYTAWAVAVGELRRWSRAVAASSAGAVDPAAARYPLLAPGMLAGTSRSATQPSSGGSGGGGFGGGGGVGGGAGGGGGGSW
jgi:hypothetical protein